MNERIRNHIEELFSDAPKNRRFTELKEELLSNSNCKYDDLVEGGASPDEAFKSVISGIGDVSELISQLNSEKQTDTAKIEESRKRSAILVSVAIGLFVLSPTVLIFFGAVLNKSIAGLLIMLILLAIGVAILVYNSMTKLPEKQEDETFVEEFRQWKVEKGQKKGIRAAISGILWPLIVVIYFLVSFLTGAWHLTWLLYIIGACIEGVISLLFELRKDMNI
jgi:hypothetical protein